MTDRFIDLTDGSRLEAKINFGTLYYLQNNGGSSIAKRIDAKKKKTKREPSDNDKMEFTARVIHAILRSNGRQVTFDEALMLMPPDPECMQAIIDAYQEEMEKIKKKQDARNQMKTFSQK